MGTISLIFFAKFVDYQYHQWQYLFMMIDTVDKLSPTERSEYSTLVRIVRTGVASFVEAGKALEIIRDKRLYREKYETFDLFCQKEFGLSRSRASRLITGVHSIETIASEEDDFPFSERVAREFRDVPLDLKQTVWDRAKEMSNGHKPTSESVKKAAIEVLPQSKEKKREYQDRELLERLRTSKRLLSVKIDMSHSPLPVIEEAMRVISQIHFALRILKKSLIRPHYVDAN